MPDPNEVVQNNKDGNHERIGYEYLKNFFKKQKYPIDFITCVNSLGNGLIIDYQKDDLQNILNI